jgi:hypothetical protein
MITSRQVSVLSAHTRTHARTHTHARARIHTRESGRPFPGPAVFIDISTHTRAYRQLGKRFMMMEGRDTSEHVPLAAAALSSAPLPPPNKYLLDITGRQVGVVSIW